jgi:hypothetical protein
MSNIVLTSENRILGIPVKYKELNKNEQIVATNATLGMLYYDPVDDSIHDYEDIDENGIIEGTPVCLPLIEDYKNHLKKKLLDQIEQIDNII